MIKHIAYTDVKIYTHTHVNIPCRHLKSTSQIQGAFYAPLPANRTNHRDFHQLGCILYQAARYFNHSHHTTRQSPEKQQGGDSECVCVRETDINYS